MNSLKIHFISVSCHFTHVVPNYKIDYYITIHVFLAKNEFGFFYKYIL